MSGALGGTLALVMFVGAAVQDASLEQRQALKACLEPLRDDSKTNAEAYRESLEEVLRVMGPEWQPAPEWQEYIDRFLS